MMTQKKTPGKVVVPKETLSAGTLHETRCRQIMAALINYG